MIYIDPNNQSSLENYKLLSSLVIPRPIAFITSINEDGVVNAAPFSFFNIVGSSPPMLSVSIGRRGGKVVKHTAKNILANKEFVVHIVDENIVKQMNQSSYEYSESVSEIAEIGLSLEKSKKVSVPSIKEAYIRMECILNQSIEVSDKDGNVNFDLILGEIVMFQLSDDIYEEGKVQIDKINIISRLGGADYAKITDIFTLDRPK